MPKTDSSGNGWTIDLSAWQTMEPIMAWQDAAQAGDFRTMATIMTGIIKAWPFEADPADPDAYKGQIAPRQFKEAAEKVGQQVGAFFRNEGG
jgi:hypothetical protein